MTQSERVDLKTIGSADDGVHWTLARIGSARP